MFVKLMLYEKQMTFVLFGLMPIVCEFMNPEPFLWYANIFYAYMLYATVVTWCQLILGL